MELNEIDRHDEASVSLKVILLIFAIVLIGVLAYMIKMQNGAADTTDYSAPATKKTTTATTEDTVATPAATAVVCGDEAYAYSLTFGDMWTGYKVKAYKPAEAIIYCYFEMPTTSTEATWTSASTDHDPKYASVFAVGVYTPAQWAVAKTEPNASTELGHNASYYWGWSPAQALPEDLQAKKIAADVKNIVATFKIVP